MAFEQFDNSTGMLAQEFGSIWTKDKLDAVEEYLGAYTKIMKKQTWARLLYLDAFCGSGTVVPKDGHIIDGSAIRALKYPFTKYYFFDSKKENTESLRMMIESQYPGKTNNVVYANNDSNKLLLSINTPNWKKDGWRGVAFLDPYAMQLNWSSLECIAKTQIFDVWYLFPLMALNRMLVRSGDLDRSWQEKIDRFLGTNEWKNHIYTKSPQLNIFGEGEYNKVPINDIRDYVLSRFGTIFPTVSQKAAILRNDMNSPLFLLCFMGSNPSPAAKSASLRVANHLLSRLDKH